MRELKSDAKDKARVKARKAAWENDEPEIHPMDYVGSLVRLLNFHNVNVGDELKRNWAIAYWKAQKKNVRGLSSIKEQRFRQVGVLVRQIERGAALDQKHLDFIDNKYKELIAEVNANEKAKEEAKTEVTLRNKPNIQDLVNSQASAHIAEIDAALDEFCKNETEFDIKTYLKTNQIGSVVSKRIGLKFSKDLDEMKDVLVAKSRAADLKKMKIKECDMTEEQLRAVDMNSQLIEGYSQFSATKFKRIVQFLENIVDACSDHEIKAKVTKAPAKRKEKPAAVLVSKLKWLPEFAELNLKSVRPEKIVMSNTVYLYDTAKRRIIRYIAQEGMLLSVRNSSIMNFDPAKSGSKILRKPELQLNGVSGMTKRPINEWYNGIKSTEGIVRGRTTDSMIILGVF